MKFDEWVEIGIEKGFAGFVFDWVQGGPQLSDDELEKLENGDDPEIFCLRIFRDKS